MDIFFLIFSARRSVPGIHISTLSPVRDLLFSGVWKVYKLSDSYYHMLSQQAALNEANEKIKEASHAFKQK